MGWDGVLIAVKNLGSLFCMVGHDGFSRQALESDAMVLAGRDCDVTALL